MTNRTNSYAIPRERWSSYFDTFAKRFLRDEVPEVATIHVADGARGRQRAVSGVRVLGITYDRRDHVLDVALEGLDHLVLRPVAIWAREAEDGFIDELTVLREDGLRETIALQRADAPAMAALA